MYSSLKEYSTVLKCRKYITQFSDFGWNSQFRMISQDIAVYYKIIHSASGQYPREAQTWKQLSS